MSRFPLLVVMRVSIDCFMLANFTPYDMRNGHRYHKKVIRIASAEIEQTNGLRQRLLRFEFHIQALSKIGLGTHRLKNENAEPDHPLLRWLCPVLNRIEDAQNQKVM